MELVVAGGILFVVIVAITRVRERRRVKRIYVLREPNGPRTIIVTQEERRNPRAPWPPRD